MSKTLNQIFIANPSTTMLSTDLLYLVHSPYTSGTDSAITYANLAASSATSNGKVNTGLINQLAYYAAAGNTLSGLSIVNSAGLLTSAGGVPGWVAYTGTGAPVLAGSPTFTTQITLPTAIYTGATNTQKQFTANSGAAITIDPANGPYQTITLTANTTITLTTVPSSTTEKEFIIELLQDATGGRTVTWANILFATNGGSAPAINAAISGSTYVGISGTSTSWIGYSVNQGLGLTTGTTPAAGYVGQTSISTIAIGSATSLTTDTAKTITSLTLAAGNWIIWGNIGLIANTGTLVTNIVGSINTTTNAQATSPNGGAYFQEQASFASAGTQVNAVGQIAVSVSVSTTYYLVATATFSVSTATAYGSISALRVS